MFAAINVLLAVFVWFVVPETRGIALEEIDVLFGGTNHVEKGGDLMAMESRPGTVTDQRVAGKAEGEHIEIAAVPQRA